MSVSDPLLKDLKGLIIKLMNDINNGQREITDSNLNLVSFCECLECILKKGLIPRSNTLGFSKETDAWIWLQRISKYKDFEISFAYKTSVERVENFHSVVANVAKFRLLIRSCLVHRCLHVPVQALATSPKVHFIYDQYNSILGDEILREIFISLLLQCANLKFNLALSHASFLDKSWLIPTFKCLEVVPTTSLGMSVSFVEGKAVIANIKPCSIADDDENIEVGDILDQLNDHAVTVSMRGKLNTIMQKGLGKPVKLRIIKSKIDGTGNIYPPILPLLRQLKISLSTSVSKQDIKEQEENENGTVEIKTVRAGYELTYIGMVDCGKHGEVKQIEKAIALILSPHPFTAKNNPSINHIKKPVLMNIQEIGVNVTNAQNDEIVLNHSYMEIASCGTSWRSSNYFAYIAGDKYCNLSKVFTCFVFHCKSEETVNFILQSIGQGFQRTHYAV